MFKPEIGQFARVPLEHLMQPTGQIAIGYDKPLVFYMVMFWAIAMGSNAISGPLGRGTLEMMLAQPISRLRWIMTHGTVTLIGVLLLGIAAWGGTACGIATTSLKEEPPRWHVPILDVEITNPFVSQEPRYIPLSEKTKARYYIPASLNLVALGVFLAGLTTAVSAMGRNRSQTIGIVAGFCVIQSTIKLAAIASKDLRWMAKYTFFGAYEPQQAVYAATQTPSQAWAIFSLGAEGQYIGLGPLGMDLLLISLGILGYGIATVIFCRRDLPAPL